MNAGSCLGAGVFLFADPQVLMSNPLETIASPCSGACQLDALGLCLGCRRTGHEIAGWRQMSDVERSRYMHEILPARGWQPVVLAGE